MNFRTSKLARPTRSRDPAARLTPGIVRAAGGRGSLAAPGRLGSLWASAVWAGSIVAVSISLAFAQQPGPRFRTDGWHADEYGRADGYPVGTRATSEQLRFLIGAYSRGDGQWPTRDIAAPSAASPLGRAATEPAITYRSAGGSHTLDNYLDQYPTTALLIVGGDRILVERYQYDRRDTDRFTSQSMAKTVLALLIGIAVQEGSIRSIEDTAETYVAALRGSEYGRTPIKALLQMSSGIDFKYSYSDNDGPSEDTAMLNRLRRESVADAVLTFNRRVAQPGTRFNYTSADSLVLGLVLTGATGRTVSDYAREKLWEPLGAEARATWRIDRSGKEMLGFGWVRGRVGLSPPPRFECPRC